MTQSNETQQKQEDFERIIRDINIKPIIEEEVRRVRAEKDFIFMNTIQRKAMML